MKMQRHCFALDLVDDPILIGRYKEYHAQVWPEIIESIKSSGIEELEIYNISTRLFMIMTVNETFSFERKKAMDAVNSKVQEWETLMWKYQQALPSAKAGEKWLLMNKIFQL